jgi:hypothetical protein
MTWQHIGHYGFIKSRMPNNPEDRRSQLNTGHTLALSEEISRNKEPAPAKRLYKSVPDNYKALSEAKYYKVIADLETVLLEISTDGVGFNTPDGKISTLTLKDWAAHLRDALEALSKAQ